MAATGQLSMAAAGQIQILMAVVTSVTCVSATL
jgi:hypothetical protein